MSIKDKIYKKSPYILKYFFLNIIAYLNLRKRYTSRYYNYLQQYIEDWTADKNYLNALQKRYLKDLLIECYQYVPLYRAEFDKLNITDIEIQNSPYETLFKLPFLTKEIRKNQVELLINQNPNRPVIEKGFTSGTSGTPTLNYLDLESNERSFALWSRFHYVIGLSKFPRTVRFSGRLIIKPTQNKPPFWMNSNVGKQLFMSSYHLKDENLKFYIQKIKKYKPELIDGYPSSVYIIAKYINRHKLQLNFSPKAICTTAETLYDYQKDEIERAFNCKVYNQYASSEGSPFITECREGRLHINVDSGVFEFINKKNEKATKGEIAKMIVTSFRNFKVPLIRYDIGDTVLLPLDETECKCGCKMPYVEKIIGREDDILWTQEKGFVGRMDTAYKGLYGIVKSQIIQKDAATFVINQVVDNEYDKIAESILIQNLKDRLGESIIIIINIVEDIPIGANGKFDAVKREFDIDFENN